MKILPCKSEAGKSYIKYLKEKHNIELDYGDVMYRYKANNSLLKPYLRREIDDTYYVDYTQLPDTDILKDIKLCYSVLHQKYVIIAFDYDNNLITIEYLHRNSVKQLIKSLLNWLLN